MKVRITLSIILVFTVSIYLLTVSSANVTISESKVNEVSLSPPPPAGNLDGRFLIGAQNTMTDGCCSMVHYDSLEFFNYVQQYNGIDTINGRCYPLGNWAYDNGSNLDRMFADVSTYAAKVKEAAGWAYGFHNSRISMARPKLEWLCFGQRSDYKCNKDHIDSDLWFYSFQTHNSDPDYKDDEYGNGNYVRFCRTSNSTNQGSWVTNPGIVVSRLRANTEQCRMSADAPWIGDWECDWLIKPRIRIDPAFVINNPEGNVCKITVLKQDGSTPMTETIIKGKHFRPVDQPNQYNGEYIEEYYLNQTNGETPSGVTIQGAWGDRWFYCARGNETNPNNEYNKADIQVYWYGNCDMWIDYVRVDNDIADQLFKGQWDSRIEDEVTQIGNHKPDGVHQAISNYYIEYTEFNNIPCMGYVNKKIKQYSDNPTLSMLSDWYIRYANHLSWDARSTIMNPEHVKRFFIDSAGQTAFYAENYPYRSMRGDPPTQDCFSEIPYTLPKHEADGPGTASGILALPVSPDEYDEFLFPPFISLIFIL